MDNYFEELKGVAITVCDREGNILDMNAYGDGHAFQFFKIIVHG